ncbi:MAG TPA: thiamine biosynthesis protein ThiS [Desulfobulbaceae bacterium]|nr:thiamine biosynthesis protein ThiS [Desulfobulbaceae bacterium]
MKIMVNGEQMEMNEPVSVAQLLAERKVASPDMVSVEVNEEILAREAFATTVLTDNDTVEFIYFMGGGSAGYDRYRPKI